jgi:hypothetical protein
MRLYDTLYSMWVKLAECFEFLDRTRQISPGGSGLGWLPFVALISKVSEGSGSASSTSDSPVMASSGVGSGSSSNAHEELIGRHLMTVDIATQFRRKRRFTGGSTREGRRTR